MAGVYIKGLEMPTDFAGARLIIYPNGQVLFPHRTYIDELNGVEAIPVPPHGRLIEKHEVFKLISAFPEIDKLLTVEFMKALYNLPTIIPADREGEA